MFNKVNDYEFGVLKKRSAKLAEDNYEGIDTRIIPSLKRFNTLEHVTAVWSCSGHNREECKAMKRRWRNHQKRYIIFVAHGVESNQVFLAFESWMSNLDFELESLFRPELKTYRLDWCSDENGGMCKPDHSRSYFAWEIVFCFHENTVSEELVEETWSDMVDHLIHSCERITK